MIIWDGVGGVFSDFAIGWMLTTPTVCAYGAERCIAQDSWRCW